MMPRRWLLPMQAAGPSAHVMHAENNGRALCDRHMPLSVNRTRLNMRQLEDLDRCELCTDALALVTEELNRLEHHAPQLPEEPTIPTPAIEFAGRGVCTVCANVYSITVRGNVWSHTYSGQAGDRLCDGAGQPPARFAEAGE
jgi:hypothetical protein